MLKVAEKADSPEDTSYLNPVVLKNVPLRYTGGTSFTHQFEKTVGDFSLPAHSLFWCDYPGTLHGPVS